ncbi:MAG TPA: CPBP family intramembrane glutamic endopeptidase [Steroidobacteraceae bacterium]
MATTAGEPKLRIRIVPIVLTILLGLGLPILAGLMALGAARILPFLPRGVQPQLPWLYSQHAFQLLLALVAIAVIKRRVPADYGLHRPRGKTYVPEAILWGIAFGIIMTLVDYAPQILARVAPSLDYPLTMNNVVGWMSFEFIYVGPTEEIPFRALLVTFLAATMPGKIQFGRYRMNAAGVIVALIFALAHISSFWLQPLWLAIGQQFYAFALGVLYAYWLEKSQSVLAPIIGHNLSDGVEYALLYGMVAIWH